MIKHVQIDPNGLCNAKCWFCPVAYGGNPKQGRANMSLEMLENILKQLRDGVGDFVSDEIDYVLPFHYNEVFLYPHFEEMAQLYSKYGFKVPISTNGIALNKTKVDILKQYPEVFVGLTLNIPSMEKEEWARYTGMNPSLFDKVIQNIHYAVEVLDHLWKNNQIYIQVNGLAKESMVESHGVITLLENAPDIDVSKFGGNLEKNVKMFKKEFPELIVEANGFLFDRAGSLERFGVMTNKDFIEKFKKKDKTKVVGCKNLDSRTESWIHITATGDVIICCQDYEFETVYGNINNNTLKEIWYSVERKDMIKKSYSDFCISCMFAIWE